MQAQHTPIPWHYESDAGAIYDSTGSDGSGDRTDWVCYTGQRDDPAHQANAAFIVTAVNNFDPLVKALENALDRLERVDRIAIEATASPFENHPLFEVAEGRKLLAAVKKGEQP